MKKISFILCMTLLISCCLCACGEKNRNTDGTQTTDVQISSQDGGITDYVQTVGELKRYDEEEQKLYYSEIEVVDENDTERIKQLREAGIEPDFPNGYYLHYTGDSEIGFAVAEDAHIEILLSPDETPDYTRSDTFYFTDDNGQERKRITAGQLQQELTPDKNGDIQFRLCGITLEAGTITEIKEKWTP